MEDKVVDNKATKKILESVGEDDAVYSRERTEFFFKVFWGLAALANFVIIWNYTGSASIKSHLISFVLGVFAVKIYYLIPAYMDLAEDVGVVIPGEEFEERKKKEEENGELDG